MVMVMVVMMVIVAVNVVAIIAMVVMVVVVEGMVMEMVDVHFDLNRGRTRTTGGRSRFGRTAAYVLVGEV